MEVLDILESHYNAFINLAKPRDFFSGLTDYMEYADNISEINRICMEILEPRSVLEKQSENLKGTALIRFDAIKNDLVVYIEKNTIRNGDIGNVLHKYERCKKEKAGMRDLFDDLSVHLCTIIEALFQQPEHRRFAALYGRPYGRDRRNYWTNIDVSLPNKEFTDLLLLEEDLRRGSRTNLWGQVAELMRLYQGIKNGKAQKEELRKKWKETKSGRDEGAFNNYTLFLSEWLSVVHEQEKDPFYFNVSKIKPWVSRFHNYILANFDQSASEEQSAQKILTGVQKIEMVSRLKPLLKEDGGVGFLQVYPRGQWFHIGGMSTRKYKLVKCLFNPKNDVGYPYDPVFQSNERLFDMIRLPKDGGNTLLNDKATAANAQIQIIENTTTELQKSGWGGGRYLKFERDKVKNRMRLMIRIS